MAWLVVAAVLLLPFVLIRNYRYGEARIALLVFWIGCLGGAAFFFVKSNDIRTDLETVHTYPLSAHPGKHQLTIAPLSQRSMKAVLTGGAAPVPTDDLGKLQWRFTDNFVSATWYSPREHDGPALGETLLFYVDRRTQDGPLHLEYQVGEGTDSFLRGRSLAVTHDAGAKHMLFEHALVVFVIIAWGLLISGVGWMIAQIACEVTPRPASKNKNPE